MTALTVFVTKLKPAACGERAGVHLVVWSGCVLPVIVLAVLVWYGTAPMPDVRREAEGPRTAVSGERFW